MKNQLKRMWSELVRRRVVRTCAVYAAVAFITLQLGEILFPAYGVGPEGLRALITCLIAASPLALAASWVYDVSAPSIRRTPEWRPTLGDAAEPKAPSRRAITAVLVAATGLGAATWWILGGMSGSGLLLISLPSILASLAALYAIGWCSLNRRETEALPDSRSVAVLPFLSWGSVEAGPLAETLAEELRVRLQREHGFRVAARQSSNHGASEGDVRALGLHLGVSTVVEGSLVRHGSKVRVSAQLVDTRSGFRVSSHSWAFKISEVIGRQDRIAETIGSELVTGERDRQVPRAV